MPIRSASRLCVLILSLLLRPALTHAQSSANHSFPLAANWRAEVQHDSILAIYAQGKQIAANTHLLRRMGEGGNCPADGFRQVAAKGAYFTIEQQTCSGWLFVDEYITFKYDPRGGAKNIVLWKYSLSFTDRRDPDKAIPNKVYAQKATGAIRFQDARASQLFARFCGK